MQKRTLVSLIKAHGAKRTHLSTNRVWQPVFCISNKHAKYKCIKSDFKSHPTGGLLMKRRIHYAFLGCPKQIITNIACKNINYGRFMLDIDFGGTFVESMTYSILLSTFMFGLLHYMLLTGVMSRCFMCSALFWSVFVPQDFPLLCVFPHINYSHLNILLP